MMKNEQHYINTESVVKGCSDVNTDVEPEFYP